MVEFVGEDEARRIHPPRINTARIFAHVLKNTVEFVGRYEEHSAATGDVREYLSWFLRLRSLSLFTQRLQARGEYGSDRSWARRMRAGFEKPFWW